MEAGLRDHTNAVALYEEAGRYLAGGVSSNVRYASVPVPLFFERGEGARLHDVDGNVQIDYVLGNGPAILGHAPPPVVQAVARSLVDGQVFAAQNRGELALARRLCALLPGAELVRFATSGTEAVQLALRIARAFTGRRKVVKFEGHYHGWTDSVYVSTRPALNEAGPDSQPVAVPESPGMAPGAWEDLIVLGWNDLDRLAKLFEDRGHEIAAVLTEPMMVNGGVILPEAGYLDGARRLCETHGALLICDEVITGFRLGLTGAQGRFGVGADLSIYAKAVAAGFPLAVVAGRRDVMEIVLTRGVMHGGTYNGNVQSMAAALATLDELERDGGAIYGVMERRGTRLMEGLRALADRHGLPVLVQGVPTMFQTFFTTGAPPRNYREAAGCDRVQAAAFSRALQEEGVRVNQRCSWFLSAAQDDATIEETLQAADRAMARLAAGHFSSGA